MAWLLGWKAAGMPLRLYPIIPINRTNPSFHSFLYKVLVLMLVAVPMLGDPLTASTAYMMVAAHS